MIGREIIGIAVSLSWFTHVTAVDQKVENFQLFAVWLLTVIKISVRDNGNK